MGELLTEGLKTGQNVELSDALSVGGMVTGMGMGIVFAVLVILMLVLVMFRVIFYKNKTNEVKNDVVKAQPAPQAKEEMPDAEIVAAMVAAIAESTGSTANKIRIKSIRRIN